MEAGAIDIDIPVTGLVTDGAAFQTWFGGEQIKVSSIQHNSALFGNQSGQNLFAFTFFDINPVEVQLQNLFDNLFHRNRKGHSGPGQIFVLSNAHRRDFVNHGCPEI